MLNTAVNLYDEVQDTDKLLKTSLFKQTQPKLSPVKVDGILTEIKNHDMDVIEPCLGELGRRLRAYLDVFDLHHPYSDPILKAFTKTRLSQEMCEALEVGKTACDEGAVAVLKLMRQQINDRSLAKDLMITVFKDPPPRAMKDRYMRDAVRMQGRLSDRTKDGTFLTQVRVEPKYWIESPDTMRYFVRLSDFPQMETERRRDTLTRFSKLGMECQAKTYMSYLSALHHRKGDDYCGFYRASLSQMVCTLGKVHNFVYDYTREQICLSPHSGKRLCEWLMCNLNVTPPICHMVADMRGDDFTDFTNRGQSYSLMQALEILDEEDQWQYVVDKITQNLSVPLFGYGVRAYMMSAFRDIIPSHVVRLIDALEEFHDCGDKAVFDHYLLIVPGVALPKDIFYNQLAGKYLIRDGFQRRGFANVMDAYYYLDKTLIQQGLVCPIIVGQKDDMNYLIGYWTQFEMRH